MQQRDKKNYLIHVLFVRQACDSLCLFHMVRPPLANLHEADQACFAAAQEFEECLKLIEQVLEDTDGLCEYAIYVKALIRRQRGKGWGWSPSGDNGITWIVQVAAPPLPPDLSQGIPPPLPGQVQESLQLFQQATALNPHNTANLKQVRTRACHQPD